jgi:putative methyltransferase (TIGR01177 family)
MHLILLSGENLKLARLEAESLLKLEQTNLKNNMLYCTIPSNHMDITNRLAYTRKVYEVLYITSRKNLESSITAYPWSNVYDKSFCVRITSEEHYDERYYAGFVWKNLEKSTRPKVNLDNPGLFIEIFIDGEEATVTRLLYQNFETFEDRKAHLRPVLHPTAMHPKMARALVNIVNSDTVIDPFCGACGILTEAGMLGVKFTGYDIDKKILEDARKNLEYYNIDSKKYKLSVKDSTTLKNLKNVVTDLPYGKSSKRSEELVGLYSKFLRTLAGRAVIVMPNFMPYKKLLDKNLPKSLVVLDVIDHYVHKSLTRKIIIIDLKNKKVTAPKTIIKTIKHKQHKIQKTTKYRKSITQKIYKNISKHKVLKKKIIKKIVAKIPKKKPENHKTINKHKKIRKKK